MVMINTTITEMNAILKKKLSRKDFESLCFRYGIDVEGGGEYLNFEVTSDRVEIISKFSVAHLLGQLLGVNLHRTEAVRYKKLEVAVKKTHRPFVNLLYVKLDEPAGKNLAELLTMQDKFDKTVGRNRNSAAIGLFDFSKLKFPIVYEQTEPSKVSFVPLGLSSEKNYSEIILETEKGRSYRELLEDKPIVWKQKGSEIFAMPPIINADFSSVTKDTKSLFIDITGNNRYAVNSLTKALMLNLQFLGEVSVIAPKYEVKDIDTGLDFKTNKFFLDTSNVSKLLGVEMSLKEMARILKSMDYGVLEEKSGIVVVPPFYRQDVIHQVDIVDDIMRFYGVENVTAIKPHSYTVGRKLANSNTLDNMVSLLIGFGYQELDLNVLTSEDYQFKKTKIKAENYAPLIGQKSGDITMARANLCGEMLRFLSNNLHKKFPQKLFDIGFVLARNNNADVLFENRLRLSICYSDINSTMTELQGIIYKLLRDTFSDETIKIKKDASLDGFSDALIKGRSGLIYHGDRKIGVIGEIHPSVLNEFKIETPVSIAEIYLDSLGL